MERFPVKKYALWSKTIFYLEMWQRFEEAIRTITSLFMSFYLSKNMGHCANGYLYRRTILPKVFVLRGSYKESGHCFTIKWGECRWANQKLCFLCRALVLRKQASLFPLSCFPICRWALGSDPFGFVVCLRLTFFLSKTNLTKAKE